MVHQNYFSFYFKSYILEAINNKLFKMHKYLIFIWFLSIIGSSIQAQKKNRGGDYYYKLKTYDRAVKSYKRELKKNADNGKILEKLTDSYLKSNLDRSLALPYAEKLVNANPSIVNILNYGKALFYDDKFEQALEQFDKVKGLAKEDEEEYKSAEKYSNWLVNAQAYKNNPIDVTFINLGSKINTRKSEINPMVTGNDRLLMYSSNRRYHSDIGIHYYNVCISHNSNHKWLKPKTVGSTVNSGYDEIVSGISVDGEIVYIYHNRDWVEQIGYANYLGNYRFSRLETFDRHWGTKRDGTYGVWQSASKDTIYFVAENGKGNADIYYSLRLPDGALGYPRIVPGKVNSSAEENFPCLSTDGKRLYFSSDGPNSMGGFDLFYSEWDDKLKEWGTPVNLGYPINDTYDNYTISYPKGERYAYISAIRPEGYGERDIYKLIYNKNAPNHLIMKCRIKIKTDSGNIIPPYRLKAELIDSIKGNIVGEYTSSLDSADFIMAIQPGKYLVNFYEEKVKLHTVSVNVPEFWFESIPQKTVFIIPKKTILETKESK